MNTLSISIDDNFIIINTIEFYCVIFKNLKIDGSLLGAEGNVPGGEECEVTHGHNNMETLEKEREDRALTIIETLPKRVASDWTSE